MKSYSLFEFDESKASRSTSRDSESFNEELLQYTLDEINYIVKNIETFKQNDEEIFDSIYRRSRLMSGLLRIHYFHDINYLLELLVFCTDFLRHNLKNKSVWSKKELLQFCKFFLDFFSFCRPLIKSIFLIQIKIEF